MQGTGKANIEDKLKILAVRPRKERGPTRVTGRGQQSERAR
jgi:hypothetical protein